MPILIEMIILPRFYLTNKVNLIVLKLTDLIIRKLTLNISVYLVKF